MTAITEYEDQTNQIVYTSINRLQQGITTEKLKKRGVLIMHTNPICMKHDPSNPRFVGTCVLCSRILERI